ncbi:MAG: YbhB/YbcL family Raf kinase inhibitor-like protein [Candidatus Liptonbacteria bacterium]|nr:YbhB/YbcL family Raf kinase inhibitor-like protein [Candidatus Liptonbacteria bacterium]
MLISSPAFESNQKIPTKFTCDGGNINPELHIQNVPEKAKSLALIMDDPDAPSGTFTHWLIWNIDPKTEIIKQESVPPGAHEGQNDAGKIGYLGPCPPDKKPHRYFFKLYALSDSIIETESIRDRATLESIVNKLLIEKAELVGIYER